MKNRKTKYVIFIILGVMMVIGALVAYRFDIVAVGGGLMGGGMVLLVRGISKLNNPKAAQEEAIEEGDERNIAITHKAFYLSSLITMGLLAIGTVVFAQMGHLAVALCFVGILFVQLLSMSVAKAVLNRKM